MLQDLKKVLFHEQYNVTNSLSPEVTSESETDNGEAEYHVTVIPRGVGVKGNWNEKNSLEDLN